MNTVGPSWGDDITRQARNSLIVFLVLIALYIAWRLETKMAIAAIVAVIHDVLLSVGVYSIFQIEVTPATVISFLTILGFSLYDTIVVYDRVQENAHPVQQDRSIHLHGDHAPFAEPGVHAVGQHDPDHDPAGALDADRRPVRLRPEGPRRLLVRPAHRPRLRDVLVAVRRLAAYHALKEREPRFAEIRKRLIARGVDVTDTAWHGVATTPRTAPAGAAIPPRPSASGDRPEGVGVPQAASTGTATMARPEPAGTTPYGNHPPRPRKKKKR